MKERKLSITPTYGASRIGLLDIFRGFALLGIFVVNIRYMASSVIYTDGFQWMREGIGNQIAWWILNQFFNSKFFPIFSFLFGVGFGMQINKMEEKGTFAFSFFFRRYSILFCFGIFHLLFIWGGDVLALYALAGMLVLLIRKLAVKYILILSLVILIFPYYGHILYYLDQKIVDAGYASIIALKASTYQDLVNINLSGSLMDKMNYRLSEYSVYYRNPEYFPFLLAMIFIGYSAGKVKFYNKIYETVDRVKYLAIASVVVIIAIHILRSQITDIDNNFKLYITMTKLWSISNVLQAFLYLYLIALLHKKGMFIKILEPLAYAGRMSLTNYLMQSIFGFILFGGLFFGLYGKLGIAWLGLISVAVYLIQILYSKYWLQYFKYGPMEWIWRQLTYKTKL